MFNEFSLRVMKIPPATSVTIEGNKVTFSWMEDGGFFGSEDEADQACLTERSSYQWMTYGRVFPPDSAQCVGPTIFPRAKKPLKRAAPIFEMVIKSRTEDQRAQQEREEERAQLKECLTQINQVLDCRLR
jgi:hypothetical protein